MASLVTRIPAMSVLAGVVAAVAFTGQAPRAEESELVERGRTLYGIYCKSCHGDSGRGEGPAGKTSSPKPADLTLLADSNGGEFPTTRVYRSLDGRESVRGHEDRSMPIWGLTLQELDADTNQEEEVREKILHLTAYLESIQKQPS